MRSVSAIPFASLALLLGIVSSVRADPEVSAIWETECFAQDDQATTKDCEAAIDQIWKMNGGVGGKTNACINIASSGGCHVALCNVNDEKTTVAYGAIATAAQTMHAICKHNPSTKHTGGFSKVEGFEQNGESHSIGTVSMANAGRKKKRGAPSPHADLLESSRRAISRSEVLVIARQDNEDEIAVPGTNHILSRGFVQHSVDGDGDLTTQMESTLRDRLVTTWNTGGGAPTIVTVHLQDGDWEWTLSYSAFNNADLNRVAVGNRQNLIDSFFRLRRRNNNPTDMAGLLRVNDGTRLGMVTLLRVWRPQAGGLGGIVLHVSGIF